MIDLGPKNCDSVRKKLARPSELAFIDPVEPRSLLQAGTAVAAMVGYGNGLVADGWIIDSTEEGRCFRGVVPTYSSTSIASAESDDLSVDRSLDLTSAGLLEEGWTGDAPPLKIPVFGQAAFSAAEETVYVVGGSGPGELGAIRRYNLASRSTESFLPSSNPPSPYTLGIAYDPLTQRLFVLDVKLGADSSLVARLARHELGLGTSAVLMQVPFEGDFHFFSIDVVEGGRNLVLVAASNGGYSAWRIDSKTGTVLGHLGGPGIVLEKPSMGDHLLFLPTWEDGGIRYRPLPSYSFTGTVPCDQL